MMEYLFLNNKISFWKAGLLSLLLGLILFLSTAARAGILSYLMFFFVWINLKYRGFNGMNILQYFIY